MCEFGMGDRFGPRCGITATEDSEIHKSQSLGLLVLFPHLFVGGKQWRGIGHITGVFCYDLSFLSFLCIARPLTRSSFGLTSHHLTKMSYA